MAFTVGAIAAKDGGGATVGGGLVAADTVGGGVGPWFLYHGIVDGLAGVNKAQVTAGSALKVDGSAVTQPVSLATLPVTNAGTFAVQATLGAETTKVIGTARIVGNAGAIVDFVGQNATSPANSLLVGAQFNTSPTTITSGSASPLQVDNAGNLLVNIKAGAGSGGTALADEATFTEGTTSLTPIGGVFKTSHTALTTGQAGALALTSAREALTQGKVWDGTNTAAVKAASTAPLATDTALVVGISPNSAGIIATGTQASPSSAYISTVAAGDIAAAATDSGNPVKIGAKATNAEPTALTTGQRANLITDLVGKLIVLPYANPENFVSGAITTAMTGTTSTSLIAAPAAGLRNYITQITVSNAHATQGTDVIIQDGSGGTTLYNIPAAAVYGGAVITFPTPLRQPTTATAIFCANVTTGASTKASASGYKGA